jgi:guanosine-3',5'-bis(diphosphate) 3'-pyrophosphohydrolase
MRKPIRPERDHDFLVVARKYFRGIDLVKIEFAHAMAVHAHKGQEPRHSGDPYIRHPERTALSAIEFRFPVEFIVEALLHDIFEDSRHLSVDDVMKIRETLGADIVVDLLTLSKRFANPAHEPAGHAESNYIRVLRRASFRVQVVKMLDRWDNLGDISEDHISAKKRERTKQTTREYFVPLAIVLLGNMKRTDEYRFVIEFLLEEFKRLSRA